MPQSSVLAHHVRLLFSRMLACLPLPLPLPGVVKETTANRVVTCFRGLDYSERVGLILRYCVWSCHTGTLCLLKDISALNYNNT